MADTELKDLSSTSFGYLIAFLLPGLVLFYGLSFWYPTYFPFSQLGGKADATIGPSIVFLLGCLTAGLLIGAARWFLYEKAICRASKFSDDHFMKLSRSEKLPLFKAVVDEHYRYHQFYGSLSIALIPMFSFLVCSAGHKTSLRYLSTWIIILVSEGLLVVAARDCYCKYVDRGNKIVSPPEGKS